jgi:hypothetical protein
MLINSINSLFSYEFVIALIVSDRREGNKWHMLLVSWMVMYQTLLVWINNTLQYHRLML